MYSLKYYFNDWVLLEFHCPGIFVGCEYGDNFLTVKSPEDGSEMSLGLGCIYLVILVNTEILSHMRVGVMTDINHRMIVLDTSNSSLIVDNLLCLLTQYLAWCLH